MCGEIDENVLVGQELAERLSVMARMLGLDPAQARTASAPPTGLAEPEGRAGYMEALFSAGLGRALADTHAAEDDEKVDAIACQAIAFARLAGFLAGQLPPEADLFRSVMEAVMAGHAETERIARDYRHRQDELHGHSHDDDGGHHHHPHDHHHH